MAKAKKHYIPGYIWHITHRCHKRPDPGLTKRKIKTIGKQTRDPTQTKSF